ncbi:MAG TPA: DUF885 family protein [Gemmatimonadaceae bacterium]|nr:DUF885 family protein [Gemmatimonadaceae bacterium]
MHFRRAILLLTVSTIATSPAAAQDRMRLQTGADGAEYVPTLVPLLAPKGSESELRDIVARFSIDANALGRRWNVAWSPSRREHFRQFYRAWQSRLRELDFDRLGQQGRIDYVLMNHALRHELSLLDREEKNLAEAKPLVPFAQPIFDLMDARRRMEVIDPAKTAQALVAITKQVEEVSKAVVAGLQNDSARTRAASSNGANDTTPKPLKPTKVVAHRSSEIVNTLKSTLTSWYNFYSGYDPLFTWWARDPYRRADSMITAYHKTLRERIVGFRPGQPEPIIGDPIGRDEIIAELKDELIVYTPEELVTVAEREFAWSEAEMKKASRELGFGDDWKKALESVKQKYVAPGEQPELIRRLAFEAIEFIEQRDLVTVPPLARDIWRVEMMSPERQRVSPFFLGGETIQVSYPTDGMSHEDKMMSMRGNSPHLSHATVHHELIPGHHLQGFMNQRYNGHRRSAFGTPFWTEGWALYWEMLLWDLGFNATPEDKVGALFWRMHRSARIIFSLGFHLGTMTPQQAIDFLVDRVGHERANAEAEVRRSFIGTYPPLYQLAYMMGGLQFRSLHRELVGSGRMSNKDFHDAILKGGAMPVEMVRAMLVNAPLTRDYQAQWRYAGDLSPGR